MAKAVFDKAEALRRYREGEKVTDIAVDMGVSKTEVYNAIRELKRAEEWGAVKALASGAAESGAVTNADGVSGADNTQMPAEGERPSEDVSVGETAAEKPAPKKRGRKKKAEEPAVAVAESETPTENEQETEEKPLNISDIQAAVMGNTSEDSEEYADSVEEWAARKAAVSDIPKCYFIKLRDNSELTVYGVCEVIDKFAKVAFVGKSGKAVIVYAGELVYYCEKNDIDTLGDISVE